MSIQDKRIKYADNMKQVVDKMNAILDEIISTIGNYPSLKEYIEGLTGGIKGTITTSPDGVPVGHGFGNLDYQVILTAKDSVSVWWDNKNEDTVTVYASETAEIDFAILSTTDALKLVRDNAETVQEVVEARKGYPSLKLYLDYLESKTPRGVVIKRHIANSYAGQVVMSLPEGEAYVPGTNTLTVYVGGVKQRSNLDFNEISASQIRFNSAMDGVYSVELIWYDFTPANLETHAVQHMLGGGDEINISGLQILPQTIPDEAMVERYVKHLVSAVAPTTGTWKLGDIIYHSNPQPGGFIGWICTKGGAFGTWDSEPVFKPYGLISK